MKRYEDFASLPLRVGFSFVTSYPWLWQTDGLRGGNTALVGNPIGVGALYFLHFGPNWWSGGAGAFILIGLKTRWAALASAITMGVAAFIAHSGDALAEKEKALLYFIGFWPSPWWVPEKFRWTKIISRRFLPTVP